eukprot:Platyproteum_vivax@DN1407_c0_g1_i1.p1
MWEPKEGNTHRVSLLKGVCAGLFGGGVWNIFHILGLQKPFRKTIPATLLAMAVSGSIMYMITYRKMTIREEALVRLENMDIDGMRYMKFNALSPFISDQSSDGVPPMEPDEISEKAERDLPKLIAAMDKHDGIK